MQLEFLFSGGEESPALGEQVLLCIPDSYVRGNYFLGPKESVAQFLSHFSLELAYLTLKRNLFGFLVPWPLC